MRNILVVIDMQNDFINGSLGTKEAEEILPNVIEKVKNFDGEVFFTRDTHQDNYLETREGKWLPVKHCIENTHGWEIEENLDKLRKTNPINKPTFGSKDLGLLLEEINEKEKIDSITLVGLCTDICVISNALLIRAFVPEVEITIDSSCCAGVTPDSHNIALEAMKSCQVNII